MAYPWLLQGFAPPPPQQPQDLEPQHGQAKDTEPQTNPGINMVRPEPCFKN